MKRLRNVLFWLCYLVLAVWLQVRLPGLDALAPGILLSLQEERRAQTGWLLLIALLVQEGTGTLNFGSCLVWYALLFAFFFTGRRFFVTSSLVFVVILSAAMGALHSVILFALSSLQELPVSPTRLMEQGLAQALLIPPLWWLAVVGRKRVMRHAHAI